jgi:hypothetical protein
MVSTVGRNLLTLTLPVGFALAIAWNAGPTARSQPRTELVVAWPDPVLHWNAVTLATATAARKDPIAQQRILDLVHLAIFEAVNAITGDYEPYLGSIGAAPGASADAAATAAAHAVLTESLPDQAAPRRGARELARESPERRREGGRCCARRGCGEGDDRSPFARRVRDGEVPRAGVH